ncbi:MAG TPA: endolytic transglycosylase MltG [Gemmatimonadales bacterium]|nr:endolytic transglycosylase MltG [Gemmatimonadales bacterium]
MSGLFRRAPVRPCVRAFAVLCVCASLWGCGGPSKGAPLEAFFVPKGGSLHVVAESLLAHRVIPSTRWFLVRARLLALVYPSLHGLDHHLTPGRYEFRHGERTRKILEDIVHGNTADYLFTVPEGSTIWEIAHDAHAKLAMDSAAFVAAARDTGLLRRLDIPHGVRSAEGYLYPETYRVPFGAPPERLVDHMVQTFQERWDSTWDRRAAVLGLTRHQIVTLASIVEAEARKYSERQIIAGVYVNRLHHKPPMRLEADPTVIYGLGKHISRVMKKDLQVGSQYNTYKHVGLPPGPISSPGRPSLLATLYPAKHNYLFFVARPDGTHMFSRTWAEHTDSVKVARRLRAEWQAEKDSLERAARRDSLAALAARRAAAKP